MGCFFRRNTRCFAVFRFLPKERYSLFAFLASHVRRGITSLRSSVTHILGIVRFHVRFDYLLLTTVLLAVMYAVPTAWIDNENNVCLSKLFSGKECLGCGMTRAIFHLLHGDVVGAFNHNRMCILVMPLLGYLVLMKCKADSGD